MSKGAALPRIRKDGKCHRRCTFFEDCGERRDKEGVCPLWIRKLTKRKEELEKL